MRTTLEVKIITSKYVKTRTLPLIGEKGVDRKTFLIKMSKADALDLFRLTRQELSKPNKGAAMRQRKRAGMPGKSFKKTAQPNKRNLPRMVSRGGIRL